MARVLNFRSVERLQLRPNSYDNLEVTTERDTCTTRQCTQEVLICKLASVRSPLLLHTLYIAVRQQFGLLTKARELMIIVGPSRIEPGRGIMLFPSTSNDYQL